VRTIAFISLTEGKRAVTFSLILINSLLFLFVNLFLGDELLFVVAQNNDAILVHGEIWRLFTANWFHANIFHLLSNMVGLLIFGLMLENAVSKWQFLLIYFCSGLAGNIASLLLAEPYVNSLGASGCIFGVLAASFIVNRRFDPAAVGLGIVFSIFFVLLSIAPQVDTWAHAFGTLAGIILGYSFTPKNPEERFRNVY
jgi:rhomboid protease GluP